MPRSSHWIILNGHGCYGPLEPQEIFSGSQHKIFFLCDKDDKLTEKQYKTFLLYINLNFNYISTYFNDLKDIYDTFKIKKLKADFLLQSRMYEDIRATQKLDQALFKHDWIYDLPNYCYEINEVAIKRALDAKKEKLEKNCFFLLPADDQFTGEKVENTLSEIINYILPNIRIVGCQNKSGNWSRIMVYFFKDEEDHETKRKIIDQEDHNDWHEYAIPDNANIVWASCCEKYSEVDEHSARSSSEVGSSFNFSGDAVPEAMEVDCTGRISDELSLQ